MAVFKIRIDKPNKKAPHYRIVRAPSIQSAEYYALEEMLLPRGQATIEDHFKMGYTPFINSVARSEGKSIFEFQSDMVERNSFPAKVRIIREDEANPSVHYAREYDESIFQLWEDDHDSPNQNDAPKPFYTEDDLKYFSSVVGKRFSSGSSEAEHLRLRLADEGVFAKTDYWAKLLHEKGFRTEFKFGWQHSGKVRSYAWARVYLPELKTPDVFFTIGVGSRLSEASLEYKLDCRRDKLSPEKIKQFDDYVATFCPESRRQKIEFYDLKALDWEKLVALTTEFLNKYSEAYKILTGIISEKDYLPKKLARLCWNENGWEAPSGPNGKSRTSAKSFEKEKGYGYEEWFFETERQIDGYHYAFLRAFNKGDHEGERYEIHLYAINDTGKTRDKYWVGVVKELEVLTKEEAREIVAIYKKRGWLDQRLTQLNKFGIQHFNFDVIPENDIFNVRFKTDTANFVRYNPYVIIDGFEKAVGSNHYVLLDKKPGTSDKIVSGSFQFSEGHNPDGKKGNVTSNFSARSYTKTLLHEEMKTCIYNQLKQEFEDSKIKLGTENPTGFGTSIDLVVNDPVNGLLFYEIKTGSSALSCIREALGQIIEYCYYPTKQLASKLIIVSPHLVDTNIRVYMNHLRNELGINIYYQHYSVSAKRLENALA